MKSTKKALFLSMVSMLLCVAMLMGTTYAWFTDTVTSGNNRIISGNLDIELYHESPTTAYEKVTEGTQSLFKDILWEPGVFAYETFTVKNEGSLALKYRMALNVVAFTSFNGHNLTEVLQVTVTDSAPADREKAMALSDYMPLRDWNPTSGTEDVLYPVGDIDPTHPNEKSFTVVICWKPTENDNLYNTGSDSLQPLSLDLGVRLEATQLVAEYDSFGADYDEAAETPIAAPPVPAYEKKIGKARSASVTIQSDTYTYLEAGATPTASRETGRQTTEVQFEPGSLSGQTAVLDVMTTNTLFNVTANGAEVASVALLLTVDGQAVTGFNGKAAKVTTYISAGLDGVTVSYNGSGDPPTEVEYDPEDGKLTFMTTHFSEFTVSGKAVAFSLGEADTAYATYEKAAESALSKDVTLTDDADRGEAFAAAKEKGSSFIVPTEKPEDLFEARIGYKYFATLGQAMKNAESGDTITVLQKTVTADVHEKLDKSLTIKGNGASFTEPVELDLGTYFDCTDEKRVIVIDNLGKVGIWGNVDSNAQIELTLTGCRDVHEVLILQGSGANVITKIENCTFDGKSAAGMTGISQDCGGRVTVENCTFADLLCGINVKNDFGALGVTVKNCVFTDCGLISHSENKDDNKELGAAIRRGAKTGATGSLTVESCRFEYSNEAETILGADIIVGENRTHKDGAGRIVYEVKNTDAVLAVHTIHPANSAQGFESRTETAEKATVSAGDNRAVTTVTIDPAKTPEEQQSDIDFALNHAQIGETLRLILPAGTFTVGGGTSGADLTVIGTADSNGNPLTVIDNEIKATNYKTLAFSNVTFEKVTIRGRSTDANPDAGTACGWAHNGNITYKRCRFVGSNTFFNYDGVQTLLDCTFAIDTPGYALWTYGNGTFHIIGCEFDTIGKAVKIYSNGHTQTVNIVNCSFYARAAEKAAVELDLVNSGSVSATVDGCLTGGSFTALYHNKGGNPNIHVTLK